MIVRALMNMRATSDLPLLPLSQAFRGTWLWEALGGGSGTSIAINERTAMQLSAVWTCVSIRAGLLASLPLKVYQRQNRGRRVARELSIYKLLHDRPSPEDTSYSFRHKLASSALLSGNGYAELQYDRGGRLRALYPWPRHSVRVQLGTRRGEYSYLVTDTSGERTVDPSDMIHLRGYCPEGLEGESVIRNHRRSLGLAVRTEVFASNFYDNGARASGVLMYPGKLSDKGRSNLAESFDQSHAGTENAGKTILLEEGAKYQQLTIPPDDAQFIETRRLGRAEIAGLFRVPTMLVPGADTTPPTYASSESFMRYIVDFTLRDDLTMWQQELNSKLFPNSDYYCEFDLNDLLRADSASRAQFHKAMWEIGAKSENEIRADENENPIDGGDRYFVPMNYIPLDKVDTLLDAKQQPATQPPDQAQTDGTQPNDNPGVSRGLKTLLAGEISKLQEWGKDFSEARAAKRLETVLLAIAIDAGKSERIAAGKAAELAAIVRGISDIPAAVDQIVKEIAEHVEV